MMKSQLSKIMRLDTYSEKNELLKVNILSSLLRAYFLDIFLFTSNNASINAVAKHDKVDINTRLKRGTGKQLVQTFCIEFPI